MTREKSYTKKELTLRYRISYNTLAKWMRPILPKLGMKEEEYKRRRVFTISESKIIIEHLG